LDGAVLFRKEKFEMTYQIYARESQIFGIPAVSITKYSQLYFNKLATDIIRNKNIDGIRILWDKEKLAIGFKCIKQKDFDRDTFVLRKCYNHGFNVGFSVAKFIEYIKYDNSYTKQFPVKWSVIKMLFEMKLRSSDFISN
jgi:hypothetical protein